MRKTCPSHVQHLIPATCGDEVVRSPAAHPLLLGSTMFGGLPSMRANRAGVRSRKSMLESLVRHLPMVRLSISSSLLAMVGCTGLIDAPPPTKAELARQIWVDS